MASSKTKLILSMLIFGTIGLLRRLIPYSSAMVAFFRGAIATIILIVFYLGKGKSFDKKAIKENLFLLILSGALIGFNWILLFEAYQYTTVSVATICYYMAPVFTVLAAPFVLKEKITTKKALCCFAALLGMVCVSGVIETGISGLKGVVLGLGAAVLYACVILINKKLKELDDIQRTIFQLGPAAIAVLPYWLLTDNIRALNFDAKALIALLVAGLIHTALAYVLYFGSIKKVSAQSAAIISYIDPIVAVLISALVLNEGMSALAVFGVILVISSALISELGKQQT